MGRLRKNPKDRDSWDTLTQRYGLVIYDWCRRWGLQHADAEEVTANVFAKVAQAMGGTNKNGAFRYDPGQSFRAWLKTIAHHEWCDFLDARKRAGQRWTDEAEAQLDAKAAEDAERDLSDAMQAEFQRELLQLAMPRVQARVEVRTWEAFRKTALEGVSGADAAAALGMPLASVFQAKSRVQRLLKEEVEHLLESEDR
jgi:RNA polymerase sigma-70 factor (ECF subfamily)